MAKVKSDTKTTTNTKLFGRLSRCFLIMALASLVMEVVLLLTVQYFPIVRGFLNGNLIGWKLFQTFGGVMIWSLIMSYSVRFLQSYQHDIRTAAWLAMIVSVVAFLIFALTVWEVLPCSGEFRILDSHYRLDYDHGGCPTCGCSMLDPACNPQAKEIYNCLLFGDIVDVTFLTSIGIVVVAVIYDTIRNFYIRHK